MSLSNRLPLFPLNVVLCPGEELPLHIFEPRYREMIRRCLDERIPFGVVLIWEDQLAEIGCRARIEKVVRRFDDGRLDIVTIGEDRFLITEVHEDRAYLTGTTRSFNDRGGAADILLQERAIALHMRLLESLGETIRPTSYKNTDHLAFDLAPVAGLTLPQKQQLLEMQSETTRLKYLIGHFTKLIPRLTEAREKQQKVQSNGHFTDEKL